MGFDEFRRICNTRNTHSKHPQDDDDVNFSRKAIIFSRINTDLSVDSWSWCSKGSNYLQPHNHYCNHSSTHNHHYDQKKHSFPRKSSFSKTSTPKANILSAQTSRATITAEIHAFHLATLQSSQCSYETSQKLQSLQSKLGTWDQEIEDLKFYVSISARCSDTSKK